MNLVGLSSFCGNNLPGLFDLHYVPTSDIDKEDFQEFYKGPFAMIDPYWQLDAGKSFYKAPVIQGRNSYTESENVSDAGLLNTCVLSVFLPFDSEVINTELSLMTHHHFIIRWRDLNGLEWTLGTIKTPCTFSKKFDAGTKIGSSKGYTLTWTCITQFQRRKINGLTA